MTQLPGGPYDVYGSAPPRYVLVHGIGGDRTQWRPLARYLASGAGVLAIDLAGHGAAADVSGPYRIGRYAADVAEIAAAQVSDGTVLIGHSMGAAVCLEAARIVRAAARHVIGLDALLFPELFGAHTARKSASARVLLRTPLARRAIDSWAERFFVAPYDPAVRERVIATMRNTARPVLADSVASLLSWGATRPSRRVRCRSRSSTPRALTGRGRRVLFNRGVRSRRSVRAGISSSWNIPPRPPRRSSAPMPPRPAVAQGLD